MAEAEQPKAKEAAYQAAMMPWAGTGDDLEIGPVTFWDYYRHREEKIKDKAIRDQLDKILACYRDKRGEPVQSITIMSHGPADFRILNGDEIEEVTQAADAHTFSSIYYNTTVLIHHCIWTDAPASSDRFQHYFQNFSPGNDFIWVHSGVSSDAWPIEKLRLNQPWSMGGTRARAKDYLIEAFDRMFEAGFPADDRRRIMRALEWFRMAQTQVDSVHVLAKIVMMATAFEILCSVGGKQAKGKTIRDVVERRLRAHDSYTDTREEWDPDKKAKVKVTLCLAAWWAQEFYRLRNAIAHGDDIDPPRVWFKLPKGKKQLRQLEVATVVFGQLLVCELEERKLCGDTVDEMAAMLHSLGDPKTPVTEFIPGAIRAYHDFDDAHQVLGWVPIPAGRTIRWDDHDEDEIDC